MPIRNLLSAESAANDGETLVVVKPGFNVRSFDEFSTYLQVWQFPSFNLAFYYFRFLRKKRGACGFIAFCCKCFPLWMLTQSILIKFRALGRYEIGVGIVFGVIIGFSAKIALRASEKRNYIDKRSFLSVEIALAVCARRIVHL